MACDQYIRKFGVAWDNRLWPLAEASTWKIRYNTNGLTWLPSTLEESPANSYGCQLFFLPDGTLANTYFRYGTPAEDFNGPTRIECAISTNGGANFAAARLVTDLTGRIYRDPVARSGYDYISATTDRQAGVIYVTYQALTGPTTNRPRHNVYQVDRQRGYVERTHRSERYACQSRCVQPRDCRHA